MEARIITDCQQWNDFVAASECCNITQSYEWGELTPDLGGEALRIGVVDDQGNLCAAMLTLISPIPILRKAYFYAPRGPVIDEPDSPAMTVLLNFVKAEAHKRGAFMLKIEPSVEDGNTRWLTALHKRGFRPTPYSSHFQHEWVLDLRPDEKTLLAGMKEKWRYNIRLAGRKGVSVRRGEGQADIDTFYRIYETTSERDEFFIHNKTHYENVMRLYSPGDRAALFLAEYEGEAIAGMIVLRIGRWSWYMYGASSNEHRNLMPNHLL
ncbi:MAG: aminoacyltransferase, partial [Chloroflexi bacterium]